MMQLDDVVSSTLDDPIRMEEAMYRSLRWLDRCIEGHKLKSEQNLFPIVQGGLNPKFREVSAKGIFIKKIHFHYKKMNKIFLK